MIETGWLQVRSGRKFHVIDPFAGEVDINDIAHALSNVCRFAGHVPVHYSVAQHSVLVSQHVEPDFALHGLLHDAHEAFIGDIPRPIKHAMPPGVREWFDGIEKRLNDQIYAAFGLAWPSGGPCTQSVKDADNAALVTEARDLMSPLHPDWHYCEKNGFVAWPEKITPWPAEKSKRFFLDRFHELHG